MKKTFAVFMTFTLTLWIVGTALAEPEPTEERYNGSQESKEVNTGEKSVVSPLWEKDTPGASLELGKNLKGKIMGGRLNWDAIWSNVGYVPNNIAYELPGNGLDYLGLNVNYDAGKKLYGGVGYYRVKGESLKSLDRELMEEQGDIWSLNAGYRFSENAVLEAGYAQNARADQQDKAWHVQLVYGNYDENREKGSWNAYVGYRSMGAGVGLGASDDMLLGTRGFEIGAAYAPFKNVGFLIKYFDGKAINDDDSYARKVFGRLEMFF